MRLEANVDKITKLTTEVTDETLTIINKFHERIHVPSAQHLTGPLSPKSTTYR